jgi:hypothetical protein
MENLFFFHWQHKGSKKRQSRPKQSIPQIFKTVVVLSVITKTPLGTPSASTAIHNVQLAIKDTNLPNINILHLKNCTKIPHDIDILCCQPKIFH